MSAPAVQRSNLELAPRRKRKGKQVSYRALAKIDFEPWETRVGDGDNPVPSSELLEKIGIVGRLAFATMFKTRDELIAMYMDRGSDAAVDGVPGHR